MLDPNCPICGEALTSKITDFVDQIPCEVYYICPTHGEVGFWAYGYYDPAYPLH